MKFKGYTLYHERRSSSHFFTALLSVSVVLGSATNAVADEPMAPPALSSVSVPFPSNSKLNFYVKNKSVATRLGKALFWDMAVGSDGVACASCHYNAGVDNRHTNQLSPGLLQQPQPDLTFDTMASGGQGGPNYTLVLEDFPLHQFNDSNSKHSGVKFTTNDAVTSAGSFGGVFQSVPSNSEVDDICARYADQTFNVNHTGTRKVEPRQAPSIINSVFNFRNFWDGRANNVFNGVDPFGLRNGEARVYRSNGEAIKVNLRNASLASQSVGTAISDLEMVCAGRNSSDLARKLIPRNALAMQEVHRDDSMLSSLRNINGAGLTQTYGEMVKEAFRSEWWEGTQTIQMGNNSYSQMEANWGLFFGLSVKLYQATLISDKSPYDEFAAEETEAFDPAHAGRHHKLTSAQRRGLDVFLDEGKCINCHKGSEFSAAASNLQKENEENGLVERMRMGNSEIALYDQGFYNIGVTPTNEDIGVGGEDPFGNPLSFSKQFVNNDFVDPIAVDTCTFEEPFFGSSESTNAEWVDNGSISTYANTSNNQALFNGWNGVMANEIQVNMKSARATGILEAWVFEADPSGSGWRDVTHEATLSTSHVSSWENLEAIRNDIDPSSSTDKAGGAYGNWNGIANYGATNWVNFKFDSPKHVTAINVYWWADGQGIQIPTEATVQYRNSSASSGCDRVPSDLSNERLAVRGAFKTPILRNVELTGPYMHNGSMSTLEQVVEFYNRGGNFSNKELAADIRQLGLSSGQKSDLVAFLKSLTDPRVANEEGPFDHPQLFVSDGHVGDEYSVEIGTLDGTLASDNWKEIPAVGRYGRSKEGLEPLKPFVDVLSSSPARFVQIRSLSEVNGRPWASAAEVNIIGQDGELLSRNGWTASASSVSLDTSASNVLDGSANTIWHTEWQNASPVHPHDLIIDMKSPQAIKTVKILTRQDMSNGTIKDYEVRLSNDGVNWGAAIASGTLCDVKEQVIELSGANGLSCADEPAMADELAIADNADQWAFCAQEAGQCSFPGHVEARFVSVDGEIGYYTGNQHVWCLSHMFGLNSGLFGMCEYKIP